MPEDHEIEIAHDTPSFVAELRRLADALERGEPFTIDLDGETVAVPATAILSVSHEREDDEVELEFQLSWSVDDDDDEEDEEDDAETADAQPSDA